VGASHAKKCEGQTKVNLRTFFIEAGKESKRASLKRGPTVLSDEAPTAGGRHTRKESRVLKEERSLFGGSRCSL